MEPLEPAAPFDALHLDRRGRESLARQVYAGLRDAILGGHLAPGTGLPSTRELARQLGVGRNTAIAAYEQLQGEGFIESRVGAGTRVVDLTGDALDGAAQRRGPPPRLPLAALSTRGRCLAATERPSADPVHGAFVPGLPALDRFPNALWSRLLARHQRRAPPAQMGYAQAAGFAPLREAIAAYLRASRGVRCEASQVVVVCGAQAALDLAARMLLEPGEAVWLEEPGYPGARGALVAAGARPVPVPLDAEGLDVAAGEALAGDARLAYVTPSFQFPLGVTMTLERRLRLIDWAERRRAWIVEDDYDSEYRFAGRPLSAMQGIDGAGRVLYLGTFSKTMFPALRVGYLVVPQGLEQAFASAVRHTGHTAPLGIQAALAEFIDDGHFTAHLRRMRQLYARRQAHFLDLAKRLLGATVELATPAGGMQVPAWLAREADDRRLAAAAARRGIALAPMARYHLGPPARPGLYLGYAGVPEEAVAPALSVLAELLRAERNPRAPAPHRPARS